MAESPFKLKKFRFMGAFDAPPWQPLKNEMRGPRFFDTVPGKH